MTPFTEDQRNRYDTAIALSLIAGLLIGSMVTLFFKGKQIQKLNKRIFELEGWQ